MVYGYFKDLARGADSDKVLRNNTFNIVKNPKYDWYQRVLLVWFINLLIKKPHAVVLIMKFLKI